MSFQKSPFTVLSFIFRSCSDVHVVDYEEPQTFCELWGAGLDSRVSDIGRGRLDWDNHDTTLLVVGHFLPRELLTSGIPACLEGVNFVDHLTAASWAAAWRLKFRDAKARIVIVGRAREADASLISRSLDTLFGARDATNSPLVPGVTLLRSPSLEAICKAIGSRNDEASEVAPTVEAMLRAIPWTGLTANRDDHHAISNVIGAFLLRKELRHDSDASRIEEALGSLAQSLIEPPNNGISECERWNAPSGLSSIRFALIDDMAELWSPFLRAALGLFGQDSGRLLTLPKATVFDSIVQLPARLKAAVERRGDGISASDLAAPWPRGAQDMVLFLDLRLLPNRRGSRAISSHREQFLRNLAELGRTLLDAKRNLRWLDDDAKAQLRDELGRLFQNSRTVGGATQRALPPEETLLPRLLSLLDPTLPIIIFSSTHRSELTEPFRSYGNIITTFRKPVLSEMARDWRQILYELCADLTSALEQAARVLQVRSEMRTVQVHESKMRTERATFTPRAVDLFFDESWLHNEQVLTVGCVGVVAEHHDAIAIFCRQLEEENLHWGLSASNRDRFIQEEAERWADIRSKRLVCNRRWYRRGAIPTTYLSKRPPEPKYIADAAARIQAVAAHAGVRVFACSLTAPAKESASLAVGVGNLAVAEIDSLHRELVVTLTQMLLACHPWLAPAFAADQLSLSFDLADRVIPSTGGRARCEELFQACGLRYTDQALAELSDEDVEALHAKHPANVGFAPWMARPKTIVVGSDHALLQFREVLAGLGKKPVVIHRCRAVALMDFGDANGWIWRLYQFPAFPLQIHYLADWVSLRGGLDSTHESNASWCMADLFKTGFVQKYTANTRDLLSIVLSGLRGQKGKAVRRVARWLRENQTPGQAEQLLLGVGARWPAALSGTDLQDLFQVNGEPPWRCGRT